MSLAENGICFCQLLKSRRFHSLTLCPQKGVATLQHHHRDDAVHFCGAHRRPRLLRQVQRRVLSEEIHRLQLELAPHRRHPRPVFGVWHVVKSYGVPQHSEPAQMSEMAMLRELSRMRRFAACSFDAQFQFTVNSQAPSVRGEASNQHNHGVEGQAGTANLGPHLAGSSPIAIH
jgi:hypothetical protein